MIHAQAYIAALEWHLDVGVDEALSDTPIDRTKLVAQRPAQRQGMKAQTSHATSSASAAIPEMREFAPRQDDKSLTASDIIASQNASAPSGSALGAAEASAKAAEIAKQAKTCEELKQAIEEFDGLSIKRTASNIVFSSGNPSAKIMIIGEAPGTDEDRQGVPFAGQEGQLLDKILGSIGLNRDGKTAQDSVYITNILNWRPPGNRSPTSAELEISMAFIERHIALIAPKIIIMTGGTPAKYLLKNAQPISKIRGKWLDYNAVTPDIYSGLNAPTAPISAMTVYHPSFLLGTPAKKKTVWQDMLSLKSRLESA